MDKNDARQSFRFDVNIPIRYRVAKRADGGEYQISPHYKGMGINFSTSGAAIKVGKALPVKALLLLEIHFPYKEDPVLATAEVIRRKEFVHKGKKAAMVMVQYLVIDRKAQDEMTSFIISRGKIVA